MLIREGGDGFVSLTISVNFYYCGRCGESVVSAGLLTQERFNYVVTGAYFFPPFFSQTKYFLDSSIDPSEGGKRGLKE